MITSMFTRFIHFGGPGKGFTTIDFGHFIPGNALGVCCLSRFGTGDWGGAEVGVIEVTAAAGTKQFSSPLPAAIARNGLSKITFGVATENANGTFLATLFFTDGTFSGEP